MESPEFTLPDDLLALAAAEIPVPADGGWAELFLERTETLRGEWDPRAGFRLSRGIREGFAVRTVGSSDQRHFSEEGLDPDRILAACRGARDSAWRPPPPTEPEEKPLEERPPELEEECRGIASVLESTGAAFSSRPLGRDSFSLALEWRRRRIRVASSRQPVRSDMTTRAILTLRLAPPLPEVAVGLGAAGLDPLLGRNPADHLTREAAMRIEERKEDRDAPEGETMVIFAPGTGGVFFHEACGHALEADMVLRQASVFRNLLGSRVAPEFVGARDDSSRPGLEGSYAFDDEGSCCRDTVLIARGILKTFLADRITGRCLGKSTTGNGRRESFRDLPLPRMSNTFLMAGEDDPEEIVRQTPRGIYVERLDQGRADTASGDFVFRAGSGRLVEEGRLTAPLRPFSIAGSGLAALRALDRIGSDLSFGTGAGSCGKEGQQIPVAVGQPTIRLRSLAVRPG